MTGSLTLLRFHLEKAIEQIDRLEADDPPPSGQLEPVAELARRFGVNDTTARSWCRAGDIGQKAGRDWLATEADFARVVSRKQDV